MRNLIRLDDWTADDVDKVFVLADSYRSESDREVSGCAVMFFPPTSLRTRVSFERGSSLMGLQPVVFPSETLDKPEAIEDVAHYLASWADVLVVRHARIDIIEALAAANAIPVINAMTDTNHPCEVLSDLYELRRKRDLQSLRFLFVGADGNISRAWQEAARAMSLDLMQCCPAELATPGARWTDDLESAIRSADVLLTDAPGTHEDQLTPYRITASLLDTAPTGLQFNPCPPFHRGREVSADAIDHRAFVGYRFKASLMPVQQAIMAFCMADS
ncbi:ornithine carbamoyltransferase [Cryobacterium zhongshanensis]|uniref:Ornithine carbamoyltransferase n=1 Tax=Cryobacterium zhongshanensis TaxID=2928153 RepID=A0AA41QUQ2_9MICO|nr:ornithine carbamoyltransferase [Cryobacterium zhongshanensis]MCI4658037.1 ornithine carbamoyltransferase [Cryobacterium zhongshanensis]